MKTPSQKLSPPKNQKPAVIHYTENKPDSKFHVVHKAVGYCTREELPLCKEISPRIHVQDF